MLPLPQRVSVWEHLPVPLSSRTEASTWSIRFCHATCTVMALAEPGVLGVFTCCIAAL